MNRRAWPIANVVKANLVHHCFRRSKLEFSFVWKEIEKTTANSFSIFFPQKKLHLFHAFVRRLTFREIPLLRAVAVDVWSIVLVEAGWCFMTLLARFDITPPESHLMNNHNATTPSVSATMAVIKATSGCEN